MHNYEAYTGLSREEVSRLTAEGRSNVTESRLTKTRSEILRSNIFTYFNLMNICLFIFVALTGRLRNGLFMGTVIFNTLIGIYQELKAKKLLDQAYIMTAARVTVIREGKQESIPAEELVEGDIFLLDTGSQIPVDAEVLEGYLEVNESMLTGESDNVAKTAGSEISAGTIVTSGSACARAVRVGKECAAAKIMAEARKYKRAQSVLHNDLEKLLKCVSVLIIPAGLALYFFQLIYLEMTWQESVLKTAAAAVGMIPEGLVVLTSIALAVSTMRLLKAKVLVQDLFSIESLARVDVLCLDKTGTLTQGKMEVTQLIPLEGNTEADVLKKIRSYLYGEEKPNATADAMLARFGSEEVYRKTEVLPFSSDRKYAAASLENAGSCWLGAPGFLFPDGCGQETEAIIQRYAKEGCRVLMFAESSSVSCLGEHLPEDLSPAALVVLRDVLRPNASKIMEYFRRQDVSLRVISGDDPGTVSALALSAGVPGAESYVDMSKTDESYDELVRNHTVFGRVLPDQKKELVAALQRAGHCVAMTGDGVNDVPALKTADVSVAMAAGAPAARDCANIVLLDSDFAEMPQIVDEGRRVINNISRASSMYLVKTVFSVLLSFFVVIFRQPYPFLPVQLTFISALGVGIPTFILQMEPSFERIKGRFLKEALRHAAPSSLTVFMIAMFCLWLRKTYLFPEEEYHGMIVLLTGVTYLFTLYRIYSPPTMLRRIVIAVMLALFFAGILVLPDLLSVRLTGADLRFVLPAICVIPVVVILLSHVYDSLTGAKGES